MGLFAFLESFIYKQPLVKTDIFNVVHVLDEWTNLIPDLNEKIIVYATIKDKKFVKIDGNTKCSLKDLHNFDIDNGVISFDYFIPGSCEDEHKMFSNFLEDISKF